jgi:hypothetical protein
MYELSYGDEIEKFENRGDATDRAKELSAEGPQVTVGTADGRLRMVFRKGILDSFNEDTKGMPRPRAPRPPRDEETVAAATPEAPEAEATTEVTETPEANAPSA